MLQSVLLAAQRIVVSNLPEHSCVRTSRRENGDAAHNRKNGKQMQRIDGNRNLAESSLTAGCHKKCVSFWLRHRICKSNLSLYEVDAVHSLDGRLFCNWPFEPRALVRRPTQSSFRRYGESTFFFDL